MKRLTLPACLALASLPVLHVIALGMALFPFIALAQGIPEPDAASLGASFLAALASKNYGLLLSAALLGAVWLTRFTAGRIGGKLGELLTSPRGSAVLAFLGGTAALLVGALGAGQDFSLGLLLGCVSTSLTASGLWSVGKAVVEKKPAVTPSMAPQVCSAADIAQGKPGCPS